MGSVLCVRPETVSGTKKMNKLKIYIAGKVSKESIFKTHHWRDDFCAVLQKNLGGGVTLDSIDPLKHETTVISPKAIFEKDCQLINQADVLVVYLSDDISVGGSQEILIARYLYKPVIGFAPKGGKFNGSKKEMLGRVIDNYQDPFVFSTCDIVCGTIEEVSAALRNVDDISSTGLSIIDKALQ